MLSNTKKHKAKPEKRPDLAARHEVLDSKRCNHAIRIHPLQRQAKKFTRKNTP
jgi:hypothetical protein